MTQHNRASLAALSKASGPTDEELAAELRKERELEMAKVSYILAWCDLEASKGNFHLIVTDRMDLQKVHEASGFLTEELGLSVGPDSLSVCISWEDHPTTKPKTTEFEGHILYTAHDDDGSKYRATVTIVLGREKGLSESKLLDFQKRKQRVRIIIEELNPPSNEEDK